MIQITDAAAQKLKELLAAEEIPNLFLRVGVRPGGCSGFSYALGFDDEKTDSDETFQVNGLEVVVEGSSLRYLNGATIDYRETGLGGGFAIENPNAVAACGCGSSFRMRDEEGQVEPCD